MNTDKLDRIIEGICERIYVETNESCDIPSELPKMIEALASLLEARAKVHNVWRE